MCASNTKTMSTYTITRNECSHAYAIVTYTVDAISRKEAMKKLHQNKARL